MQVVKLSPEEYSLAINIAEKRWLYSELANRKDSVNDKSFTQGFLIHLWGCLGELALSKFLKITWPAHIDKFKREPDIPPCHEVRHRSRDDWDLIIRPGDDPERVYWLTTGEGPEVKIHGWILGKDAMLEKYKATHGGKRAAYFCPSSVLRTDSTGNSSAVGEVLPHVQSIARATAGTTGARKVVNILERFKS